MCKYTPGTTGGSCGDNFTAIDSTPPNASSFRHHQGVWLQDADDDGTEDLNMSFYTVITGTTVRRTDGGVLTLSPRTGARSWLTLNMAENGRDFEELFGSTSRPTYSSLKSQAQGFESGRLYGAASGFRRDGRDRTLMVGSDPVGYAPLPTADYNDAWRVMCNVSRYVGMISHPIGQPSAWQVDWSWYFGFQQAVLQNNQGSGALLKEAAMAHGCIHRYSDSRVTSSQGANAVAFSVFRLLSQAPSCEPEQRALFSGGFTDALQAVYRTCIIGTASQQGRWTVQVLDETTGAGVAALPDGYMWGFTRDLLPGGKISLIVEPFAAPAPFSRLSDSTRAMDVYELNSLPAWQIRSVATFPVTGRPALRFDPYDANPPVDGQHMIGNFYHLKTRPNTSVTGLVDILLENGRWVGYSPQTGTIVTK